jgi:hypothetical protein
VLSHCVQAMSKAEFDSSCNKQVEEARESRHTTPSSLGTCTGGSFDLEVFVGDIGVVLVSGHIGC